MAQYQHLSCADAKALIDQDAITVVDIRDALSFQSGHIPGAEPLSNDNVDHFLQDHDPDHPVVVCCYHGNSSRAAAQFLAERGFTQVYSLDGGFEGWRAQFPQAVSRD